MGRDIYIYIYDIFKVYIINIVLCTWHMQLYHENCIIFGNSCSRVISLSSNRNQLLTLRNVLWTIRVVLPRDSVKDPNKEHNFFNKSRCSWWCIVNFNCSVGANNFEFIVWRERYRKIVRLPMFSDTYNDTKIIYNKVVRTQKFDAGRIV